MSFIAAVLLLNMDVAEAFKCFANLLNCPCQVAFFRIDEGLVRKFVVFTCKKNKQTLQKERKNPGYRSSNVLLEILAGALITLRF